MNDQLTWAALAKALNTTERTLLAWRSKHTDCPAVRDPKLWRAFMAQRGLLHHNLRRNAPLPPAGDRASENDGRGPAVFSECGWDYRYSILFEIMQFLDAAHRAGELDAAEFREMGEETLLHLLKLAKLWRIPKDDLEPVGWRKTWEDLLAAAGETAGRRK